MSGEVKGIVFDIDHFAAHDGPGIRACVYLKGCPLRCAWCHSPESQLPGPQLLYAAARCVGCGSCARECPDGLHAFDNGGAKYSEGAYGIDSNAYTDGACVSKATHVFDGRRRCVNCGRCAAACPTGALRVCGWETDAADVAREILADIAFFRSSGGGATISGGEALFQPAFTLEILKLLKESDIHTIVETSGYGKPGDLLRLVPYTDCFYYDFKLPAGSMFDKYIGGGAAGLIADNLKKLREATNGVTLRVPLIPGITDTDENLREAVDAAIRLKIAEIQLLPYNAAAGAKYEWIAREFALNIHDNIKGKSVPGFADLKKRAAGRVEIVVI